MTAQSIAPVLEVARLGVLPVTPDFPAGGESDGVWRVPAFPGQLFKKLNMEAARKLDTGTLDRLIKQPTTLTGPGDAQLIAESTAWPASRIVDGGRTVGVLMPEAPPDFKVSWRAKWGSNPDKYGPLPVDYLAKPNDWLASRRIASQSPADRSAVCLNLVRVAHLFERCGIVYADWSYANAFWHPDRKTVFVFDIDGCTYGSRPHVFTPQFEDPLTPDGHPVDRFTDRYRLPLLVARMLTGLREEKDVFAQLRTMPGAVPGILLAMVTATERTARPGMAELLSGFGVPVADETGVLGWRAPRKGNRNAPPSTVGGTRPRPTSTRPATRAASTRPGTTPGAKPATRPVSWPGSPPGVRPGATTGRASVPPAAAKPVARPATAPVNLPPPANPVRPSPPAAPVHRGGGDGDWIAGAVGVTVAIVVLLFLLNLIFG
ncbi:hypothetical protein QLQ12_39180 [Actinoplanes sp. NEAU-A12]|uniref:Protein kinase domain-containing protein n=1 Tax=Actinoplanes sandaracinus TaxID=3045177 RepID=A0ABT6WY19_9ACTN|nr:hypothetical protein [Actinoplanes sandaracinus]MDI6104632.1 hypothetical protein [Actinoplanes sandaracinus]